ncbi:type IV secretory system conjugative DNA transfer family protein [Terricaulis silvestris]|uniref:Conjugal transfer protein TraG n=1 Tax=Terricaulis silvestris TaxID=2686094 RepID=A0A6I6MJU9_9CAUL|nr:type IV secretory system conjugative DNA transfer family protein [Terricaulis silvestris]QGZ94949.1 Conjugal transfer protein TraG [Terricaulis silvestris]
MRAIVIIAISIGVCVLGASLATQFIADAFNAQPALGAPLFSLNGVKVYAPWSVFSWTERWSDNFPKPFAIARLIVLLGFIAGVVIAALAFNVKRSLPTFGEQAWAKFADLEDADLFDQTGCVLGKFEGEILAYNGPGHQLLIGASRSGKGRGHIVPTLFAWDGSAVVLDIKGELDRGDPRHGFPGTSGFRATFGHVIRFSPTDPASAYFNPLFEVRPGSNEVRDVQNIVDIIVDSRGEARGAEAFWNETAKAILTGSILDTLYSEPPERKTFAVVREKLRDLDRTAELMRTTLHRRNPKTNELEVHPEVRHAAESYLAGEERLRSSIKATAESFFGLFADPLVAEKTSRSDFRIGDLMCDEKPVTLYLQPPPGDAPRLMLLMRLMISQIARSLMEHQTEDSAGRPKKHRLLLMLDEFPQLGRIDFFEKMMSAMASYGFKVSIACQSLNHITRAYGRENVIIDNCHLVTAFSAADPETAERIAKMTGEVWEVRPVRTEQRPRSLFGPHKGTMTYREERRPLLLPADVRKLPRDEQLIFVAGAKPIRAKKLRFDTEPLFAKRMRPAASGTPTLTVTHDWENVAPIGRLPTARKPATGGQAEKGARARPAKPAAPTQPELFITEPAAGGQPRAPKISEIALSGFRAPDRQTPSPVEPAVTTEITPAQAVHAPPQRRLRAEGL